MDISHLILIIVIIIIIIIIIIIVYYYEAVETSVCYVQSLNSMIGRVSVT